jgi:hypothetical protein
MRSFGVQRVSAFQVCFSDGQTVYRSKLMAKSMGSDFRCRDGERRFCAKLAANQRRAMVVVALLGIHSTE